MPSLLHWMLAVTRFKYLVVITALLGWVGSLLPVFGPRFADGLPCPACTFVLIVQGVLAFADQKWTTLAAAFFLVAVGSISGERWRYLLAVVALANWLAMHLLNYVSWLSEWPVEAFKACWMALFFLAAAAPFFRRWRELVICGLLLFFASDAFLLTSLVPEPVVLPNRWLQETGFRIYASHLVRSLPPEEFLSRCKLVDYVEEGGGRHQVGECDEGLRSAVWFRLLVIYDPSGQLAGPAVKRTLAWRLAVLHLPEGQSFVHDDEARHLVGDFYWYLDESPARGDDR